MGIAALAIVRGLPRPQVAAADAGGACHAPPAGALADPSDVRWISQDAAEQLAARPGVAFVDCRPRDEFETGHVSGAIHFDPRADRDEGALVARLAGATTVITYCDAQLQCERSLAMAKRLRGDGLPDVRVLEGGLPGWLRHGFPAESGACPSCEAAK